MSSGRLTFKNFFFKHVKSPILISPRGDLKFFLKHPKDVSPRRNVLFTFKFFFKLLAAKRPIRV